MILAFSLTLLLWQGTFAQPQLDGRYGVDRVAMEKQAKEAAQPISAAAWLDMSKCVPGSTVKPNIQTGKYECVPPSKPSPQITAVRAVKTKRLVHPKGTSWGCENLMACSATEDIYEDSYTCKDKSDILADSVDGKSHWCLKIEEGK